MGQTQSGREGGAGLFWAGSRVVVVPGSRTNETDESGGDPVVVLTISRAPSPSFPDGWISTPWMPSQSASSAIPCSGPSTKAAVERASAAVALGATTVTE